MPKIRCSRLSLPTLLFLLLTQPPGAAAADTAGAEAAAIAVMERFLAAFNARDEAAWADTLVFPHVRIASGGVTVYERRDEFLAGMDLDAFAASSGWRRSSWDDLEIFQASPDKVHVKVRFSRYDAADALMATYDSLYIIVREEGQWGVRARSSFAP